MSLFLITFLSIYGGMHVYAFFRLRAALSPSPAFSGVLVAWMLLMTLAPLLVRLFERTGMGRAAFLTAWPGYIWMGFLFLFVSSLLIMQALSGVNWLSNRIFSFPPHDFLSAAFSCKLALILAIVASVYACFEAYQIQTEHVTIKSGKLPSGMSRIRIVQLSDVHIGLLLGEKRLEHILEAVRQAQPDILVSTGDLIDGRLSREEISPDLNRLAAILAAVNVPSGKFAVTGNHEAYAGLQQALTFTHAAGFTVLRGQSIKLPNGITITGIDDTAVTGNSVEIQNSGNTLLRSVSKNAFHLLLKHRPEIDPESDGSFDLQLSGHVHKGQLFPFNFIVKYKYPIPCGTSTTKTGSQIHVSRGTGTWGPPMRLLAPPEITVIDIIPSDGRNALYW